MAGLIQVASYNELCLIGTHAGLPCYSRSLLSVITWILLLHILSCIKIYIPHADWTVAYVVIGTLSGEKEVAVMH